MCVYLLCVPCMCAMCEKFTAYIFMMLSTRYQLMSDISGDYSVASIYFLSISNFDASFRPFHLTVQHIFRERLEFCSQVPTHTHTSSNHMGKRIVTSFFREYCTVCHVCSHWIFIIQYSLGWPSGTSIHSLPRSDN